MKTIILVLTTFLTSCFATNAQDTKLYKASINNVGFQCRSMGGVIQACGAFLYDCTDGSFRRFDVVCATNVTIDK